MNQSLHDLIKVAMLRGMATTVGTHSDKLDGAVRHVIADMRAEGVLCEDRVRKIDGKS